MLHVICRTRLLQEDDAEAEEGGSGYEETEEVEESDSEMEHEDEGLSWLAVLC